MAFVTTLLALITLKWAVGKACQSAENKEFSTLWEKAKKR
jgi:hypothetical protein